jgi:hypothetical protein
MAKVFIEESTLTSIGNSIRNKTGKTELIDPLYMSAEIDSIVSGGGGGGLPEEVRVHTGNLSYKFSSYEWNSFIKKYKNQLEFKDITGLSYMTYNNISIEDLSFEINLKENYTGGVSFNNAFGGSKYLKVPPRVKINGAYPSTLTYCFNSCERLRDAENLFDAEELESILSNRVCTSYGSYPSLSNTFANCYSLRQIPSWVYKVKCSIESTVTPNSFYYSVFSCCYALDEAINLPVPKTTANLTSNILGSAFYKAARIKNMTFEKQADGTPYVVNWNKQTLDLSTAGYLDTADSYLRNYNSGITSDKIVTTDEQYQALKNDPDWYTVLTEYSRYNHDSAVATINSLPDTSAYLATISGTNTIKFYGAAGSKTDGGAINTLTEEEIAVATAKGWTVTLS